MRRAARQHRRKQAFTWWLLSARSLPAPPRFLVGPVLFALLFANFFRRTLDGFFFLALSRVRPFVSRSPAVPLLSPAFLLRSLISRKFRRWFARPRRSRPAFSTVAAGERLFAPGHRYARRNRTEDSVSGLAASWRRRFACTRGPTILAHVDVFRWTLIFRRGVGGTLRYNAVERGSAWSDECFRAMKRIE